MILGKLSNNMGRVVLDYGASYLGLSFRVPDRGRFSCKENGRKHLVSNRCIKKTPTETRIEAS